MWFFNFKKPININTHSNLTQKYIIYTPNLMYFLFIYGFKKWKHFIYTSKFLFFKKINFILYEIQIVKLKYIGKIFRLEKYKKKIKLYLHYPGKNYLIHKNIKLKWRKKI